MSANYGREEAPVKETPREMDQDSEERDLEWQHNKADLTEGETPGQIQAEDETRAPEEEGGDNPQPDR